MFENIDLDEITPIHEVRNLKLVKELVSDMRENGWQGQPLLVIERAQDYFAWTGCHRIEAAKQVGYSSVPCYVIQERDLQSLGFDAEWGHVDDTHRLDIIRKLGDETALSIMWSEGRS
jgi:hypothetical protein